MAQRHSANGHPTYHYFYERRPAKVKQTIGASHGLEMGKRRFAIAAPNLMRRCIRLFRRNVDRHKHFYQCAGNVGGTCDKNAHVRRDMAESRILDPIREELLSPERVDNMAREIEKRLSARIQGLTENSTPAEIQVFHARIGRLQERLTSGDETECRAGQTGHGTEIYTHFSARSRLGQMAVFYGRIWP